MRILSIGDIHGNNIWKEYVKDIDNYDKIIFIGDYVDSFNFSDERILKNLKDLIKFKRKNKEKVILLFGNHDLQYIEPQFRCSGYRESMDDILSEFFKKSKSLFRISYQYENYIWTHGGIDTHWWINYADIIFKTRYKKESDLGVSDKINLLFKKKEWALKMVSAYRGGISKVSSPLWCDRREIKPLENYHQIVGHSPVRDITKLEINKDTSVTFIDCLEFESKLKMEKVYVLDLD